MLEIGVFMTGLLLIIQAFRLPARNLSQCVEFLKWAEKRRQLGPALPEPVMTEFRDGYHA